MFKNGFRCALKRNVDPIYVTFNSLFFPAQGRSASELHYNTESHNAQRELVAQLEAKNRYEYCRMLSIVQGDTKKKPCEFSDNLSSS